MIVNMTLAKVLHPVQLLGQTEPRYAVRLFITTEDSDGDRPRDCNLAMIVVRKLTEPTAGDAPEDEKLLVDGPMPNDAVPLFNFFLSVKHTKYGPVFAKDYQRYDGCPVAVSIEGMKLLNYVWGYCKKENRNTAERSVRGERAEVVL